MATIILILILYAVGWLTFATVFALRQKSSRSDDVVTDVCFGLIFGLFWPLACFVVLLACGVRSIAARESTP